MQQPGAAALHVEVFDSFDAVPVTTLAAFNDATPSSFFSTWFWYRNLFESALASNDRLRLYVVRTADARATPLMVMPMVHARVMPRYALRRLRACANFYTPLFVPLIGYNDHDPARCVTAWMEFVKAERPRWDVLSLSPLDCARPYCAQLDATLRESGFAAYRYFCFGNWYQPVTSRDYAAYMKNLSGSTRNTITRKSRALQRNPQFRIVVCSSAEQMSEAQRAYQQVFDASWKRPEPYRDFVPNLIAGAAQHGALRLGIAYLGEQAVACQLWFVKGDVASIFKLAYVEQFAEWSAGTVLMSALMRHVIEVDQVKEIDFLSGDDAFKKDWMSQRRERHGYIGFNQRSLLGRCAGILESLKGRWRRVVVRRSGRRAWLAD